MKALPERKSIGLRWLATLLVLFGTLFLTTQASASSSSKGRLVKAGGHRLYLRCEGKGSPVVVLEAGLGDWSRGYNPLLARAKKIGTTVCAYDRYGIGKSGRYAGSRSVAKFASDLRALVRAAHLRGPYVLGGASLGGLIARYYANVYPKDVAGMVLFDSVGDDWDQYVGIGVFQGNTESIKVAAASARLRKSDKLGRKPLIVLEAGDKSFLSGGAPDPAAFAEDWHSRQLDLSRISSDSIFALAPGSAHWVQSARPNLSAEAVRLVVSSVRSKKPLPVCAKTKLPRLGADCG